VSEFIVFYVKFPQDAVHQKIIKIGSFSPTYSKYRKGGGFSRHSAYKSFTYYLLTYLYIISMVRVNAGDASSSRSSSQEIDSDEMTHGSSSTSAAPGAQSGIAGAVVAAAAAAAAAGGGSGGGLADPVAPLRRRRASMQDALDFTKINASLYERPVSQSVVCYFRFITACILIEYILEVFDGFSSFFSVVIRPTASYGASTGLHEWPASHSPENGGPVP